MIAFVAYVVYHISKGAAFGDIVRLRRQNTSHSANYEEYPIRFEQRYSVRSSRHPSRLDLLLHPSKVQTGGRRKELPPLPMPVAQRFSTKEAYLRYYWKERAHPGTPNKAIGSYFTANAPPSPPKRPEPALVMNQKSNESSDVQSSRLSTRLSMPPTVSVRDLSISETDPPTPDSSKDQYTRWSWTNSEAPSTPRMNLDKSDATSYHKHNGHMSPIDEDTPIHPGGPIFEHRRSRRKSKGMRSVLDRNFPV